MIKRDKKRGDKMAKFKKYKHDYSDFLFVAGLFLGLGIGGIFGNYGAGALLGLGLAFSAMAIAKLVKKK